MAETIPHRKTESRRVESRRQPDFRPARTYSRSGSSATQVPSPHFMPWKSQMMAIGTAAAIIVTKTRNGAKSFSSTRSAAIAAAAAASVKYFVLLTAGFTFSPLRKKPPWPPSPLSSYVSNGIPSNGPHAPFPTHDTTPEPQEAGSSYTARPSRNYALPMRRCTSSTVNPV